MSGESAIHWREWGADAFAEAVRTDRPILLRLSAVWCHWCHVMDSTSDKDPRAISLLNGRFVPIRVDIDKMPQVRERYNFGGFPTSAFLTPGGDILTGGTYIPPDRFVELLSAVADAYRDRKDEILAQVAEHRTHRASHAPPKPAAGSLAEVAAEALDAAAQSVRLNFDAEHGGFGTQPKFPHSAAIELALRLVGTPEGNAFETVARRTLERMRGSTLWDREEQGFFRYSVTRDWSEPHFEKMLETNAGLLRNYALAGAVLREPAFLEVARDIRAYAGRLLRDPRSGLFRGSQDADEAYYGMALAQRRGMKAPYVDPASYTDWSAEMIEGYFEAFRSSGEAAWRDEALQSLGALLAATWREEVGLHHFFDGTRRGSPGILSDHGWVLRALCSAYELGGDGTHLAWAAKIAAAAEPMWDPSRSLYADKRPDPSDLGLVRTPNHPPVENGVMARGLLRLAHHQGGSRFASRAEAILRALAPQVERQGLFASEVALAGLEASRKPLELNVVARPAEAAVLIAEAARVRAPNRVIRLLDPASAPGLGTKYGVGVIRAPSAFACTEGACSRLYRPGESFADEVARLAA